MTPKRLGVPAIATLVLAYAIGQPSNAATINASSCNSSDVQSAISNAQAGDIVSVPAGNCSWSSFTIPGGIHVRGTGPGVTNVTVNGTVTINKNSSRSTELSGFSFSKSGGGNSAKMFRVTGSWDGEPPLIHDNIFTVNDAAIFRYETNGGVIFDNIFRGAWDDSAIQHKIDNDNESWSTADTMGVRDTVGKRNLYVEDNVFEGMANQATDFDDASRVVFRYNTVNNASFNSHGLATSPIGLRHFEIYNNEFNYPAEENQSWHVWIRGGTGVIYDNHFEDISGFWGDKRELIMSVRAAVDGSANGCCRSWACDHQVGQNHDGSGQFLDALTIWNNTGTLEYGLNDGWTNSCGQNMADFLQNGRDFVFAGAAKSGYSPFTYPHPLRVGVVRPMEPQDLTVTDR